MKSRVNEELFWEKVDMSGGADACWPWTAYRNASGYGRVNVFRPRCPMPAHRVAWTLANGPIPVGMHICHRCDNPSCCNPGHLFIGTPADNMADMTNKGRRVPPPVLAGERNGHHKLSDAEVSAIRFLRKNTTFTQGQIAKQFGVTQAHVSAIELGKNRKADDRRV